MKNHALRPHSKRSVNCEVCGKSFSYESTLSKHYQDKHTPAKRQFECYLCKRFLARIDGIKTHIKSIHCNGKHHNNNKNRIFYTYVIQFLFIFVLENRKIYRKTKYM